MNCANHADQSAVAYCRTCGKALCANCTRPVKGVIYCENCLADRMAGVQPPQGTYQPVVDPNAARVAQPGGGPSPGLAGVLAGFFPFGVGAVYCGQYAKGLAHLVIFALLIAGVSTSDENGSEAMGVFFGLAIGFFYLYQIVDAVRSAKALQMGQPAPDPFGLGKAFSVGEKKDISSVPTGAIVLIVLGILFLLHTIGPWDFGIGRLWPLLLIGLGGWMFAKRWGMLGPVVGCSCARCRAQGLLGPALMTTLGVLFLLNQLGAISFHRTWPVLLLVIGGIKLMQSNASTEGHVEVLPATPAAGSPPVAPPTSTTSSEVQNG